LIINDIKRLVMKCPKCENELSDDSLFCSKCGSKIESQGKTCPNPECGRTGLPYDAIFCPDCRSKLTDDDDISIEDESSSIQISEITKSSNTNSSTNSKQIYENNNDSNSSSFFNGLLIVAIIIVIIIAAKNCNSNSTTVTDPSEKADTAVVAAADTGSIVNDKTASYLTVSEDNLSFSSEGGTTDIIINTDGGWEISTPPEAWGDITRQDGHLTLTIAENPNSSSRTDYFVIKAGNYERRINITQNGNTKPSAHIESVWMEHNVIVNGNQGMNIHTKFLISNQRGKNASIYAFFYYANNTTALRNSYGRDLFISKYITPSYDNTSYNDCVLFMPYISLNMPMGWIGNLSFDICIKDASGELLARDNNTQFSLRM
jgi:uncharacterized protein YueI